MAAKVTMHVNPLVVAGTLGLLAYFAIGLTPRERFLLLGSTVGWGAVPLVIRALVVGVSPLKVKRILSFVSCSTTGVMAVAALWDRSIDAWETEFHINPLLKATIICHMGFYTGDILTMSREQAVIPSLVGHHVATIAANALALMVGGPLDVFSGRERHNSAILVYASVLEVTGMFWYPYWLLVQDEKWRNACGRLVTVVGVTAVTSFLVVRLLYASPRMLWAAAAVWMSGPLSPTLAVHGLLAGGLVVSFCLLNVLNLWKLSRSVLRLFRPKGGSRASAGGGKRREKTK